MLLIACSLVFTLAAQSAKVNQSKKKAEISKKDLKEYVDKVHDKKVKRHLQIQTKEVQKRLKQSSKETDANYSRLNFKAWWSGLFNKNNRRKSKKK